MLDSADQGGLRSYCVQYRESDLDFIARLLAEEGIAYRFEETPDGPHSAAREAPRTPGDGLRPPGPSVVFFADSTSTDSIPEDPASASAAGGAGIRFHADGVHEQQDTVQAFGGVRGQPVAVVSAVSYDYKSGRLITAEVPTTGAVGGEGAPRLEAFDSTQSYAWADGSQAERSLRLRQEALEARHKRWIGRGVVRSFAAGSSFVLAESMLDLLDLLDLHPATRAAPSAADGKRFLLTRVEHVGVNNLPKEPNDALTRRGADALAAVLPSWTDPQLRRQAARRGYANRFEAIRAGVPWRPLPPAGSEASGADPARSRPRVAGPLLATVVGPDGSARPQGSQEIHTDRMGRVLIRYEFQDAEEDGAPASTWVRVMQPLAGDGTGTHWLPRIGHEVLVGFFDDDIERPYVICSLYNGRGDGGVPPTPGGRDSAQATATSAFATSAFATSTDAGPGAQGNLTGGASPAWHGGSPADLGQGGQANAAALSGHKTKEFGGAGFNQLVFDDSTGQLRTQLATTQHASQLNLGHLIHQADNHRGSFRGLGFELRSDAHGAVRGGQGVLLSTYGLSGVTTAVTTGVTTAADPAGDNAAGIALARQWKALAEAFDRATSTHQTVRLSGVAGTTGAHRSMLDADAAPVAAWLTQTSGMVAAVDLDAARADAAARSTTPALSTLPHGTDPVVSVSARGGLAMVAGQDQVLASEENVQLASGADIDLAAGGALRLHTGQAIGVLGGAMGPGKDAAGTGLTLIAGQGELDLQAQAGTLQVAAMQEVRVQSQSGPVDWAAAKKITLSTAGGAQVVIEGGNITVMCPGTITVRAGTKSFVGAERVQYGLPLMPASVCLECMLKAAKSGSPFAALN